MRIAACVKAVIAPLVLSGAVVFSLAAPCRGAEKTADSPADVFRITWSQEFHERIAAETDVELLLGWSLFTSRTGRQKARERAAEIAPNLGVFLVLEILWRPENAEELAWALVDADPFNAYAHYVTAALLVDAGRTDDGLDRFRIGARCERFDIYQQTIARAVFKAADALGLKGLARLKALLVAAGRTRGLLTHVNRLRSFADRAAARMSDEDKTAFAENLLALAGQVKESENPWSEARHVVFWSSHKALLLKGMLAEQLKKQGVEPGE